MHGGRADWPPTRWAGWAEGAAGRLASQGVLVLPLCQLLLGRRGCLLHCCVPPWTSVSAFDAAIPGRGQQQARVVLRLSSSLS